MGAVSTIQRFRATLEDVKDPERLLRLLNDLQGQVGNAFGILPARVTRDIGFLAPARWIDASLVNSWVSYGSGYATPGFAKNEEGRVRLRGAAKLGTYGSSAIFTLPEAFRPPRAVSFPAVQSNATYEPAGRINISAAGVVTAPDITMVQTGTSDFFSLEGVEFDADDLSPPKLSTPIVLTNLGLSVPATRCIAVACVDQGSGLPAPLPRIAWQRKQDAIVITQLFGLLPTHSYAIRLEISAE
jgi:hypothetical protein